MISPNSLAELGGRFVAPGVTASYQRWLFCIALMHVAIAGCRSDEPHSASRSVGLPGSLPAAPPELPNDEAAPSRAATTLHESDLSRKGASLDGGLVLLQPIALREDSRLAPDTPNPRDSTGVTLEAEWKANEWPSLPSASEIEHERLTEIRNKTRWSMRIDLVGSGRMRLSLASHGYALERGTELRSRVDLLGHILVWSDEKQYRILPAGALRSLFEEGRVDVGQPLVTNVKPAGPGRWLDLDTERISIANAFGHLTIDQATNPAAGVSGRLLCRWLIEFISADPSNLVCQTDSVPVHGQFDFSGGGKLEFVVTQVSKKQEFGTSSISVPPVGAAPNSRDLPRASASSSALLAEHRNRAQARGPAVPSTKMSGLVATNHTLGLRALLIDGITGAWLMPGEERSMPELLPGSYSIAWRDFFGLSVEAPKTVTLPAHISVGVPP